MKKNLMYIMILSLFLAILPVSVSANSNLEDTVDEYVLVDADGTEHRYFDVYGNPIKINDLNTHAQNSLSRNNKQFRGPIAPDTVYIQSSSVITGPRQKVTPDSKGPCNLSYGDSVTTNFSISGSLGASVQSKIFKKVKAEVNVTVAWNSSSSSQFSSSYDIPQGKVGAVYFSPYLTRAIVKYYDNDCKMTQVEAKFPNTLSNGFTDGLYELVIK